MLDNIFKSWWSTTIITTTLSSIFVVYLYYYSSPNPTIKSDKEDDEDGKSNVNNTANNKPNETEENINTDDPDIEQDNPKTGSKTAANSSENILSDNSKTDTHPSDYKSLQNNSLDEEVMQSVHIYFGSQTGTSEAFGHQIGKLLGEKYNAQCVVHDLDEFDAELFVSHQFVVFTLATYGDGEPSDNALNFYQWLTSTETNLNGMKFAIMGLGNKQYPRFNAMARQTEKFLLRKGAHQVCVTGEGNDDEDIEGDFAAWLIEFQAAFDDLYKIFEKSSPIDELDASELDSDGRKSRWKMNKKANFNVSIQPSYTTHSTDYTQTPKGYFRAEEGHVKEAFELRQKPSTKDFKSTYHLEVELPSNLTYNTADTLYIYPKNSPELVNWWIERLQLKEQGININDYVYFTHKQKNPKDKTLPPPITVHELLTHYLDLDGVPPKTQLKELACFIQNEKEEMAFTQLLSNEQNFYWKVLVSNYHFTLTEIVEILMSTAYFEFSGFVQLCPKMRARPYTIASSSLEAPNQVSVLVSRVHKKLPNLKNSLRALKSANYIPCMTKQKQEALIKKPRFYDGKCTEFLCDPSILNSHIKLTIKPSRFKLPKPVHTPIIMIGSGAGVAPFRAFWREMKYLNIFNKNFLYFGCCKSDEDWLYKEEMCKYSEGENSVISRLVCAFSRETDFKMYVQFKLAEDWEIIGNLIKQGAYLYICGGTKMGADVLNVMRGILQKFDYPSTYLDQLIDENRVIQELWG